MPLDYSKGQIYVIRNTLNDNVYVGSTTQTISRRWAEHMRSLRRKKTKHYKIYQAIEELGLENFYIEFVEAWPCENKGQLCAREGHYIRQLDSVKNGYNDIVAGRTPKECQAICRERVRERCQSDNEYRENYLKKFREYHKKYRSDEKYREAFNMRNREYYHRKRAERMQGPAQTELLELK